MKEGKKKENKKVKKEATTRGKNAMKVYSENRGNKSLGESMRDVGYSDAYADNCHQFQQSSAYTEYQENLEKAIPDDLVTKRLREYLDLQDVVMKNNPLTGEFEVVPSGMPHKQRLDAIKEVNKLKDKYPNQKVQHDVQGTLTISDILGLNNGEEN